MLGKNRKKKIFVTALVLTVWFSIAVTSAQAYSSWIVETEFDSAQELDRLITLFSKTVQKAKASKAAHPDFIADLENIVREFQEYQGKVGSLSTESSYYETPNQVEMEVRYLGRTADKVGTWENTTPDGAADEHTQILIYFPTATQVESIRIWTSNEGGNKGSTWWWSDSTGQNFPRRAWVLGVYENNRMLNPNLEEVLGWFEGWTLFDTYASIQGSSFDYNRYLLVQVTCTNGQNYTEIFHSQGVQRPFEKP